MIIARHKSITSLGDEQHHELVIDWFDRDWKILITENVKRSTTTAFIWDNDAWRPFAGRSHEESIIYNWIKQGKIIKLKYKVQ